ncbi:MAG: hypothetical protein ACXW3Q_12965, partial [Rhodoplanes sp.]
VRGKGHPRIGGGEENHQQESDSDPHRLVAPFWHVSTGRRPGETGERPVGRAGFRFAGRHIMFGRSVRS